MHKQVIKILNAIFLYIFCILPAYTSNYKIIISIKTRNLNLYQDSKIIRRYSIGVGMSGFPTPKGNFQVISKIITPDWENPYKPSGKARIKAGKNNPLGTRWIGFHKNTKGEFGIHGTNNPSSVGKYSSHGCIRMRIKDAEELFAKIRVGTPIQIK